MQAMADLPYSSPWTLLDREVSQMSQGSHILNRFSYLARPDACPKDVPECPAGVLRVVRQIAGIVSSDCVIFMSQREQLVTPRD